MAAAPDRRVIVLGLGIPLAILAVVLGASVLGRDRAAPPTTPAETTTPSAAVDLDPDWYDALTVAFEPLRDVLPRYAAAVDAWSTGERSAAELAAVLDDVEPVVGSVAAAARDLPDHRHDELAGTLVADAAELYVQAVAAHRAALASTDGGLAEQWDRLGRRLRILGDRTFDRGRERATPPPDAVGGIELRLPAEVPDFDRLELAVGPPLEPTEVDVGGAVPRLREDERPSQPLARWEAAVAALDVPAGDDVEAAVGDPDALGELARRFVAAADDLRDEPVPDGDRGRADRVALGWLVLADAARAAQLDALGGGGTDVAERLLDLGTRAGYAAG